jgi:hypothetical protein
LIVTNVHYLNISTEMSRIQVSACWRCLYSRMDLHLIYCDRIGQNGVELRRWAWTQISNIYVPNIIIMACGPVVRVPGYRSRGPSFDSRRYQIFWEVMGLERRQLSLVSATEELLGRKSRGFGLEIREYGYGNSSRGPRGPSQQLALFSPTSCVLSVGIVRSWTEATEFILFI